MNLNTATVNLSNTSLFRERCYIDGAWVDAQDGAVIEVNNPATGSVLGTVPGLATEDTRRAIAAADAYLQ